MPLPIHLVEEVRDLAGLLVGVDLLHQLVVVGVGPGALPLHGNNNSSNLSRKFRVLLFRPALDSNNTCPSYNYLQDSRFSRSANLYVQLLPLGGEAMVLARVGVEVLPLALILALDLLLQASKIFET